MIAAVADIALKKQALFSVLAQADYGTFFSHQALAEIVDEPGRTPRYRSLVLAVGTQLEHQAERTLRNVRGQGYAVARPGQHLPLSLGRQQRGRRQLARAVQILQATPLAHLTLEERKRHDAALTLLQQQADVLRNIKHRVEQAQQQVSSFVEGQLQEALARIEALRGQG